MSSRASTVVLVVITVGLLFALDPSTIAETDDPAIETLTDPPDEMWDMERANIVTMDDGSEYQIVETRAAIMEVTDEGAFRLQGNDRTFPLTETAIVGFDANNELPPMDDACAVDVADEAESMISQELIMTEAFALQSEETEEYMLYSLDHAGDPAVITMLISDGYAVYSGGSLSLQPQDEAIEAQRGLWACVDEETRDGYLSE